MISHSLLLVNLYKIENKCMREFQYFLCGIFVISFQFSGQSQVSKFSACTENDSEDEDEDDVAAVPSDSQPDPPDMDLDDPTTSTQRPSTSRPLPPRQSSSETSSQGKGKGKGKRSFTKTTASSNAEEVQRNILTEVSFNYLMWCYQLKYEHVCIYIL